MGSWWAPVAQRSSSARRVPLLMFADSASTPRRMCATCEWTSTYTSPILRISSLLSGIQMTRRPRDRPSKSKSKRRSVANKARRPVMERRFTFGTYLTEGQLETARDASARLDDGVLHPSVALEILREYGPDEFAGRVYLPLQDHWVMAQPQSARDYA